MLGMLLNNVTFETPWVLALIPLSFLVLFIVLRRPMEKTKTVRTPWLGYFDAGITGNFKVFLRFISHVALCLGWCLWLIALARPQKVEEITPQSVQGVDILFVLDTSSSMNIEDLQPNRLSASVKTVEEFVKKRVSDRMGIVVFGGESFTLCPLTLDQNIILQSLQRIQADMTKVEGTAIGTGLATGIARIRDSKAKSKVIILLTDGENNQGNIDPLTSAELAAGFGIKVYTIGIGREGIVNFPVFVQDIFGRTVKKTQQMQNSVDFSLLETISEKTKAKSFRATDNAVLESVFRDIDSLERTEIEGLKYKKTTEYFMLPLQWGTLMIGVSLLLLLTVLRIFP